MGENTQAGLFERDKPVTLFEDLLRREVSSIDSILKRTAGFNLPEAYSLHLPGTYQTQGGISSNYVLVVNFDPSFCDSRLMTEHRGALERIARGIIPGELTIVYENNPSLIKRLKQEKRDRQGELEKTEEPKGDVKSLQESSASSPAASQSDPFSRFFEYSGNAVAISSVRQAVQSPKGVRIYLQGDKGEGKTTLLRTAKGIMGRSAAYVFPSEFMDKIMENGEAKKPVGLARSSYRNKSLLLVDEIEGLAGKKGTQDQIYHLMKQAYVYDGIIVASSIGRGRLLELLVVEELKALIARLDFREILPPTENERREILARFLSNHSVTPGRLGPFAKIIDQCLPKTSSIGVLEAACNSVSANLNYPGEVDVHPQQVRDLLERAGYLSRVTLTPDTIIAYAAEAFAVSPKEITGKKKDKRVVTARHATAALLYQLLGMSLTEVGTEIGRSHSTVKHSLEILSQLKSSPAFAEAFGRVEQRLAMQK